MKVFGDDYYTVVAGTEQQAIDLLVSLEYISEEDKHQMWEVDPNKKKMWFPVDELPEQYHVEEKYQRKNWCGMYEGVEITLQEAMQYRNEKIPYIICISSDLA